MAPSIGVYLVSVTIPRLNKSFWWYIVQYVLKMSCCWFCTPQFFVNSTTFWKLLKFIVSLALTSTWKLSGRDIKHVLQYLCNRDGSWFVLERERSASLVMLQISTTAKTHIARTAEFSLHVRRKKDYTREVYSSGKMTQKVQTKSKSILCTCKYTYFFLNLTLLVEIAYFMDATIWNGHHFSLFVHVLAIWQFNGHWNILEKRQKNVLSCYHVLGWIWFRSSKPLAQRHHKSVEISNCQHELFSAVHNSSTGCWPRSGDRGHALLSP